MSKRLFLVGVLIALISITGLAQRVSVSVADTTHTQDSVQRLYTAGQEIVGKQNALNKSIKAAGSNPVPDSVQRYVDVLKARTIFSEKKLAFIRDSIEKATGISIPKDIPLKQEMSRENMVDLINKKFPNTPNAPSSQDEVLEAGKDSLQSSDLGVSDLKQFKLPSDDLDNLSILPGKITKSKYLKGLDSLRQINLKEEKLKYEEKVLSQRTKLSIIEKKQTFRDRNYFEGVLSLISGKSLTIYQASPALGYHLTDNFSLGAGPTLQVLAVDKEIKFNGGVRAFSKVEFLKRQLYVQLEDAVNPWSSSDERIRLDKHNVLIGAGVLLSVKAPVTINFSVLYRVNESKVTVSDIAPLVFRIGISTVKISK